jgi:exodeoxyribonuclease-3
MAGGSYKLATYNCNSIRARLDLVLTWLDREEPDILCLQETKVTDEEFPTYPFAQRSYHVVLHGRKAQAGVASISREPATGLKFGLESIGGGEEGRLIRGTFGDVSVVNTYVPQGRAPDSPHFRRKLEWFDGLRQYFERHFATDDLLVWAGDFNVAPEEIDVYDPKRLAKHVDFHPDARRALNRVKDWGFIDLFRLHHPNEPEQYSFWDYRVRDALERGMGWRVDHLWCTKPLAERSTDCWIDVDARRAERPSDHTFVVATFDL